MTPRILPLLALLRDGASVKQLAKRFGVDQKTARRDLIELREAGFELSQEVQRRGRKVWRVLRLDSTLKRLTTNDA